jgi:hypothetical protein
LSSAMSLNPAQAAAAALADYKGSLQSEHGGTSFAALLNSAAARQRAAGTPDSGDKSQASAFLNEPQEAHTYGFSDLGVFGMQYSIGDRTNSAPAGIAAEKPGASLQPLGAQSGMDTSQLPTTSLASVPGLNVSAPGKMAAAYMSAASTSAAFASSSLASSPIAANAPELSNSPDGETAGEPPNVGVARKAMAPLPELQKPSDVNLVVSDTDGTLAITVRSQGETAEDAIKIRRMLEQTAGEFDLRVGEFQFNGLPSIKGGVLGSCTR